MAEFINVGDTIEAEHTDATSRKIEWKGVRHHPITDEIMTLYECDRNSKAKIIKEFTCTYSDDLTERTKNFKRSLGDTLVADAISIYTKSKKKQRIIVKEGVTGRHGARFIYLREKSISCIKTSLANLRKAIEAKNTKDDNLLLPPQSN